MKLGHKTSDFSPRFRHHTSDFRHLTFDTANRNKDIFIATDNFYSMKKKTLKDFLAANINPEKKLFTKRAIVYNAEGTAADEPIVGDGVWLEYWEAASLKAIPDKCPCCNEPLDRNSGNIHGTHIQINQSVLAKRFIIPTCAGCNGKHGQQLNINYVDEILGIEAINK